ncbi:MAG TPA: hypothetical protein VIK77_07920 [Tissierellaceae bacterium]
MDKGILNALASKWKIIETSEFFRLEKDNLIVKDISERIKMLTMDDFDAFSSIHDKMNPDMYWNSERIKNNFNRWRIFTYCKDEEILAYIMSLIYDNNIGEIFGITSVTNIESNILEGLIYFACKDIFSLGATRIINSCDLGSFEKELYLNLGFVRTNDYICYRISI